MSDDGERRGSIWYWIGGGCAVVFLLGGIGLCVGPGIFAMLFMDSFSGMGATPPYVTPPTGTPTAGLELPPPPGPISPVSTVRAADRTGVAYFTVTSVTGIESLAVNDVCNFSTQRMPRDYGSYNCRTEITCGGQTLYGGPGQGFFDCSFPEYAGQMLEAWDYSVTSEDGDPSLTITNNGNGTGSLTLRDDASGAHPDMLVTGTVTSFSF